jgi:hypothetical protein
MNTRRDDRLSNLDPSSRAKLDAWLKAHTYREVVSLASEPPPHGLGFKTNIRALSVYYRKYLVPNPVETLFELAQTNPAAAHSAATAMLHAQTLYAASSPDFNMHTFNALARFHFHCCRAEQDKREAEFKNWKLALRAAIDESKDHVPQ